MSQVLYHQCVLQLLGFSPALSPSLEKGEFKERLISRSGCALHPTCILRARWVRILKVPATTWDFLALLILFQRDRKPPAPRGRGERWSLAAERHCRRLRCWPSSARCFSGAYRCLTDWVGHYRTP